MLRYSLAVFLSLLVFWGWGQKWAPVNSTRKALYATSEVANSEFGTIVVGVHGAEQLAGDSVFTMFRRFNYYSSSSSSTKNIREPGPLGITVTVNDSVAFFGAPLNYIVYYKAPLHATWEMDTTLHITAEVTSVDTGAVFDTVDSLRRIQLSDGNEWVLSKRFGVVRCVDRAGNFFELKGVQGLIGEQLVDPMDFYRFEVGDAFMKYHYGTTYYHESSSNWKYLEYIEVLEVLESTADMAVYNCLRCIRDTIHHVGRGCTEFQWTVSRSDIIHYDLLGKLVNWWENDSWTCSSDYFHPPIVQRIGETGKMFMYAKDNVRLVDYDSGESCPPSGVGGSGSQTYAGYGVGLGSVLHNYVGVSGYGQTIDNYYLVAFRTHGGSQGYVPSRYAFQDWPPTMCMLMQNPVSEEARIDFGEEINVHVNVDVFDLSGKKVWHGLATPFQRYASWNVSDWPRGLYIIHVTWGLQSEVIKMVKD